MVQEQNLTQQANNTENAVSKSASLLTSSQKFTDSIVNDVINVTNQGIQKNKKENTKQAVAKAQVDVIQGNFKESNGDTYKENAYNEAGRVATISKIKTDTKVAQKLLAQQFGLNPVEYKKGWDKFQAQQVKLASSIDDNTRVIIEDMLTKQGKSDVSSIFTQTKTARINQIKKDDLKALELYEADLVEAYITGDKDKIELASNNIAMTQGNLFKLGAISEQGVNTRKILLDKKILTAKTMNDVGVAIKQKKTSQFLSNIGSYFETIDKDNILSLDDKKAIRTDVYNQIKQDNIEHEAVIKQAKLDEDNIKEQVTDTFNEALVKDNLTKDLLDRALMHKVITTDQYSKYQDGLNGNTEKTDLNVLEEVSTNISNYTTKDIVGMQGISRTDKKALMKQRLTYENDIGGKWVNTQSGKTAMQILKTSFDIVGNTPLSYNANNKDSATNKVKGYRQALTQFQLEMQNTPPEEREAKAIQMARAVADIVSKKQLVEQKDKLTGKRLKAFKKIEQDQKTFYNSLPEGKQKEYAQSLAVFKNRLGYTGDLLFKNEADLTEDDKRELTGISVDDETTGSVTTFSTDINGTSKNEDNNTTPIEDINITTDVTNDVKEHITNMQNPKTIEKYTTNGKLIAEMFGDKVEDENYTKYAKEKISEFNWNIYHTIDQANTIVNNATPEQAKAMLELLEMEENRDNETDDYKRALGNIVQDPSNYVGLATLGWGFAGKTVAKQSAKQGVMYALRKKIVTSPTGVAVIEGMIYGGADDISRQEVSITAKMQDDLDKTQVAIQSMEVGAFTGTISKYAPKIIKGVYNKSLNTYKSLFQKEVAKEHPTIAIEYKPKVEHIPNIHSEKEVNFLNKLGIKNPKTQEILQLEHKPLKNGEAPQVKDIESVELTDEQFQQIEYNGHLEILEGLNFEQKIVPNRNPKVEGFTTNGDIATNPKYTSPKEVNTNLKGQGQILTDRDYMNLTQRQVKTAINGFKRLQIGRKLTPPQKKAIDDYYEGASNYLFAKGTDHLAVGVIAGVDEDEQGNITFNPDKFVASLGGYAIAKRLVAKGMFNNLDTELNKVIKKAVGVDLTPQIVQTPYPQSISYKQNVVDDIMLNKNNLPKKEHIKQLSSLLGKVEPNQRIGIINKLKELNKKQKTPREVKAEKVQLDFNSNVYSKLQYEIENMPKSVEDSIDDVVALTEYLKKVGVKEQEINGAFIERLYPTSNDHLKDTLISRLAHRNDKIVKKSVTNNFEGSLPTEMLDVIADEVEYVLNNTNTYDDYFYHFADGYGDIELKKSFDDDLYTDLYTDGKLDYTEMLDDWYDNYSADFVDEDTIMTELLEDYTPEEIDDGNLLKQKILEKACDNGWFFENYGNVLKYEVFGVDFYNAEEAGKYAREFIEEAKLEEGANDFSDYTLAGGHDYNMKVFTMPNHNADIIEPHIMSEEATNVSLHTRTDMSYDENGGEVYNILEIQSEWNNVFNRGTDKYMQEPPFTTSQYMKLGIIDSISEAIDKKAKAITIQASSIQNGEELDLLDKTRAGMSANYDQVAPNIIKKMLGRDLEFHIQDREGNIFIGDTTPLVYDNNKVKKQTDYYQKMLGAEDLYWRLDLTDEVIQRFKDRGKFALYGMSGIMLAEQGANNEY